MTISDILHLKYIAIELQEDGIAILKYNRPTIGNAINGVMNDPGIILSPPVCFPASVIRTGSNFIVVWPGDPAGAAIDSG